VDILVLRRQDSAFVAAFSARGATKEGIIRATEEDYLALIRAQTGPLGLREGEDREKSAWPYGNFREPPTGDVRRTSLPRRWVKRGNPPHFRRRRRVSRLAHGTP
jgi:hypothetical protein